MAVTREQVAKLYVANFNRAPDKAGLDYWISDGTDATTSLTDVNAIAKAMQAGAEAESGVSSLADADYVISLYSSLFGRTVAADSEDVTYWTDELTAGNVERANMINTLILGAEADTGSADDAAVLANKTEVGLYYADTLELDGTDFSLASVTSDTATVTSTKSEADALVPPSGETFTLTTSADPVNGTANDDVINAATGTLGSTDLISDTTTTDNDTLNVTTSTAADMAATPTVTGIENINVTIDAFAGTTATVDATNIEGATITLGSTKLGYDGAAGVANTGDNNVTAGTNVTTLTVAGLTTGTVDAGSATTVTVDPSAATKDLSLVVNGDIDADLGNSTAFNAATITATADSVITLAAGTAITTTTTIAGEGNVTLKSADVSDITGKTVVNSGTGTLSVYANEDDDIDVSDMETSSLTVLSTYSSQATVSNGSTITVDGTIAAATIVVDSTDTTEAVTIDVSGATVGALVLTDVEATTINVNQDTTIGALVGASQTALITGTGNVTASSAVTASALAVFDASALEGKLTYTTTSGTTQTIKGGTAKNTLTTSTDDVTTFVSQDGGSSVAAATTTGTLSVQSGSGVDAITVSALTTGGKIVGTLGAGDDKLTVNGIDIGTAQVTIDAGEGTDDTLVLLTSADLGTASSSSALAGFEVIELGTAAGTTATIAAHLVSGQDITIEGSANTDSLTIEGKATAQTIDLSTLTFDATLAVETVAITGGAAADVITGVTGIATETIDAAAGNDTIIAGAGAGDDQITAGAGNDTIDLTGATGINTLVWGDASSGKDTVTGWGSNDIVKATAGGSGSLTAAVAVSAGVQSAFADVKVNIVNTDGTASNLTTAGTATVTNWTDTVEVATYLAERFTVAASDHGLFVINDTTDGANTTYIYDFVEGDTTTTLDSDELVLTGVIDNGGVALTIANFSF